MNLDNGGECSILVVLKEIKKAFRDNKSTMTNLLQTLRPDCLNLRLQVANKLKLVLASNSVDDQSQEGSQQYLRINFTKVKIL